MGVQATMTIGQKAGATAQAISTGTASYPSFDEVRIIGIPATNDSGRLADIHRTIRLVIDYVRDNKLFIGAGAAGYLTSLDAGKAGIRSISIATEAVTNDFGIMVNGAVKGRGNRLDTENAHRQLLDWMRENQRLEF